MKYFKLINGLAIVTAFCLLSCNNENADTSGNSTDDSTDKIAASPKVEKKDEYGRVTLSTEEVPAPAIEAFNKKVPAATNVRYSKMEKPLTNDTVGVNYYFIDYDLDNYDYYVIYDENGQNVEFDSYPKISGLPDPVSKRIAYYFPDYKIVEIKEENDKDMKMYEVQMEKGDSKYKIKFLPDGAIYKLKS